MRDGIMEGQIDNSWNHSFGSWDIYDASGWDFTQTGLVNNPYLSEIRGLVLLNKWRSEGLSESEIQEKFIHDAMNVKVKIEPAYSGNNVRPDSFKVRYTIDGKPTTIDFANYPKGK